MVLHIKLRSYDKLKAFLNSLSTIDLILNDSVLFQFFNLLSQIPVVLS